MRESWRQLGWTVPIRVVLAGLWLVRGFEQLGVHWPGVLAAGTHSLPELLRLAAAETPFPWFRAHLASLWLPAADWLQVPAGLLAICLGLAIGSGVWLRWAGLVGGGLQGFLWLGFMASGWPLYYPLAILAHLALAIPRFRPVPGSERLWLTLLRVAIGAVWAYESALDGSGGHLWLFPGAVLIMIGLGTRWLSLLALAGLLVPWQAREWGSSAWPYYLTAAGHLALVLGGHRAQSPVVALLPERWRRLVT